MNTIDLDGLAEEIARIYGSIPSEDPEIPIPLQLQARTLLSYANSYLVAAKIIAKEAPPLFLPRLQMVGQAIELSTKACIAATSNQPPTGHDLIALCRQCLALGYVIHKNDLAAIIHLNHQYFKDLVTSTKFKSRYPTKNFERVGGTAPDIAVYERIVSSLSEQIQKILGQ